MEPCSERDFIVDVTQGRDQEGGFLLTFFWIVCVHHVTLCIEQSGWSGLKLDSFILQVSFSIAILRFDLRAAEALPKAGGRRPPVDGKDQSDGGGGGFRFSYLLYPQLFTKQILHVEPSISPQERMNVIQFILTGS